MGRKWVKIIKWKEGFTKLHWVLWLSHKGDASCEFRERCSMWIYTGNGECSKQGLSTVNSDREGSTRYLIFWQGRENRNTPCPPICSFHPTILLIYSAPGEISPNPNISPCVYEHSNTPLGCFMYMFSKLVDLSGCGMGQWCLFPPITFLVAATVREMRDNHPYYLYWPKF
jgi:hypothetical protein